LYSLTRYEFVLVYFHMMRVGECPAIYTNPLSMTGDDKEAGSYSGSWGLVTIVKERPNL
jgi:hypothetical protein